MLPPVPSPPREPRHVRAAALDAELATTAHLEAELIADCPRVLSELQLLREDQIDAMRSREQQHA